MNPGESKTIEISAEHAYGPRHDQLVLVIARAELPEDLNPQIDQRFQMQSQDGRDMVVTVTAASETDVTFDANHPLAGKDLSFDIELVHI
jgi:peptidylprolyl isomerase